MTAFNANARTPARRPNPAGGNQPKDAFRLPDPPEDPEDKMTSFDHLTITGSAHYLAQHLGSPETTLVAGDRYLVVRPTMSLAGSRYPDLLVAFDVDPAAYKSSNGYIISEQGKPPDFVLEIASCRTGSVDTNEKRRDYAALGIPEYWRFDETGQHHGARLAGDRLADGVYVAADIAELPLRTASHTGEPAGERRVGSAPSGSLQGYSPVLGLNIRWESGELVFYDPATDRPIATLEDERARADAERRARIAAEAELSAAEARVRELEELLRRRNP